jgi:phospholipid transport system substrate-binding protein
MVVSRVFGSPRLTVAARLALVMLILVVLSPALAGAGTSARGELESFFGRAIAIQTEATSLTQAREDVRRLALALFDGRDASRRALGADWDQRTSVERDDFSRTFTDVLAKAYLNIMQARLPLARPPMLRVIAENSTERFAMVRTKVRTRDGRDAQLDYHMTRPDKAWLIRDVVIDGVSLVDNYRAQFAHTRRRSSYAALMELLRTAAGARPRDSMAASATSRRDIAVARNYATAPVTSRQTP